MVVTNLVFGCHRRSSDHL